MASKILVDWDSVLVNFLEMFGAKFAELFPNREVPRFTQHKTYDLSATYGISWEIIEIIFDQIRQDSFYKGAAPMDATFFIWFKKLLDDGHEMTIMTKNPPYLEPTFQYWLGKYGIYDVPIKFVESMKDKLEADFDYLIDDAPHFLNQEHWLKNPDQHLLVYDAPYNYITQLQTSNQHRVYNWKEIYEVINNGKQ